MVAGAHGNAEAVEQGTEVGGVYVAHVEGDDGSALFGLADDAHAGYLAQALQGIVGECLLVGGDMLHAEGRHIVEGAGKGGGAYVVGGAGLKLVGQLVEGGALERYGLYHLATALVGGHAVEPVLFAVEHADARGAIYLVGAEGVEVGIEVLHIDGDMRYALCTVDGKGHIVLVGDAYHLADGVDGAQYVGDVHHGDEACVPVEELGVLVHADLATVGDGYHTQADALACFEQLPRHDIAVVLHGGDNHLVTLAKEGLAKRGGQQVDGLGGATGKDDLIGGGGIDEGAHALARCLVQPRGLLREEVYAAMHIGVHRVVLLGDGVDHRARLLRGGSIVEVHERLAIDRAVKDGEVATDSVYIVHRLQGCSLEVLVALAAVFRDGLRQHNYNSRGQ